MLSTQQTDQQIQLKVQKKTDKKVTSVLLQISRRQTLTTSSKNQLNHKGFNVCCH